jgi:hypothetical protein
MQMLTCRHESGIFWEILYRPGNMEKPLPLRIWIGLALLASLAATGCSSHRPALPLPGEYGDIAPPDAKRAVVIDLKDGKEFEIRKIQEEDDTLFAVMLDYSFQKFPKESVRTVRNVPRDSLPGSKTAWIGRKEKDRNEERGRGPSDYFASLGVIFALAALVAVLILNS